MASGATNYMVLFSLEYLELNVKCDALLTNMVYRVKRSSLQLKDFHTVVILHQLSKGLIHTTHTNKYTTHTNTYTTCTSNRLGATEAKENTKKDCEPNAIKLIEVPMKSDAL